MKSEQDDRVHKIEPLKSIFDVVRMLSDDLFDREFGVGWKEVRTFISSQHVHMPQNREYYTKILEMITLLEETKQKCFMVVAEGATSYGPRNDIYCVFPTCIISYLYDGSHPRNYRVDFHHLSLHALQCFKLSKLSQGKGAHLVLPIFQSFDQSIQSELALSKKSITEKCKKEMDDILDDEIRAFEIQKQVLRTELEKYKGIAKNYMKELYDERRAFEKEKHALETELAKYKGIVENCMKEISSYEF